MRLVIIAADPLARAGLTAMLSAQTEYDIVGQLDPAEDIAATVPVYAPDALVFDLGWDIPPAIAHLITLQALEILTVVLIPDSAVAHDIAHLAIPAILPRDAPPATIVAALNAAANGLVVLDPLVFEELRPPALPAPEQPVEPLTPRETEVLQLLAQGLTNKAVARQLAISEHTVKFHVNAIMGKLQAQSRTEAVVRGTRLGLVLL
jgi:two-component system nitrate/nitrite response regulator NarL